MFYTDVAQAAPRSIPWNCDDWQPSPALADADDPRVSLILESLAANRGKTIYCAIDQSDTFTKAETWAAGRHRNERDDTVYFGESGNFRGFLAAQEGYLTDGESGVTGVSRELIFEFPREERRRRWKWKKFSLSTTYQFGQPSDLPAGAVSSTENSAKADAVAVFVPYFSAGGTGEAWYNDIVANRQDYIAADARAQCRARGYSKARDIMDSGNNRFYYSEDLDDGPDFQFKASYESPYTATCLKRVRRR